MPNRLINEQSPYLLQHAHNPVDWYPWGDEAFELAERENKPLIVSIGYSACHWCHVMEHESFEDEDTAAYMNEHFVCVKVDREEHPDVDHMYMDAVQAIAGNGGWPLNVFVTPGRAPFYGGTYYPPRPAYSRPSWMQLLHRMNDIWNTQQDEVAAQSEQILKHLKGLAPGLPGEKQGLAYKAGLGVGGSNEDAWDTCRQIADSLLKQGDKEWGGFGNAPKFPGTMAISYLLEHYHFTGYQPALDHALLSLGCMINGGIRDQIGDGFARYSTDRQWLAPHFEKMLYDNALLISALCDAYSVTKDSRYINVATSTIEFVERELRDESGGYYCAIDADSEGVEGKFYTWTLHEWIAAVGKGNRNAAKYFGIKPEGNWEGTNILHIAMGMDTIAAETGVNVGVVIADVNIAKSRLLAARAKRERPRTDDKCLLSWNALMNAALSKAAVTLYEGDSELAERYLRRAEGHMQWMLATFNSETGLLHTWKNGVAKIPAKLDDYAFLADAMLRLGSAAGDHTCIMRAAGIMEDVVGRFGSEGGYFYYTAADQKGIPVRKVDYYDGALPSANAVMAGNLLTCGLCMGRTDWVEQAGLMLHNLAGTVKRYSYSFGYWALLLQRQAKGMKAIVCSGPEAETEMKKFWPEWLPEAYLITLSKEISELPILENKFFDGKMSIFVCSGQACLSPVNTVQKALELLNQ